VASVPRRYLSPRCRWRPCSSRSTVARGERARLGSGSRLDGGPTRIGGARSCGVREGAVGRR
jgi:hypothetical protein